MLNYENTSYVRISSIFNRILTQDIETTTNGPTIKIMV